MNPKKYWIYRREKNEWKFECEKASHWEAEHYVKNEALTFGSKNKVWKIEEVFDYSNYPADML